MAGEASYLDLRMKENEQSRVFLSGPLETEYMWMSHQRGEHRRESSVAGGMGEADGLSLEHAKLMCL